MDIQKFQRLKSRILSSLAEIEADLTTDEELSRVWQAMLAGGEVIPAWTDCREFQRWCKSQGVKGKTFRLVRLDETRPCGPDNCKLER